MKFLLDENISPRICKALWEQMIDCCHLRDRGLLGASDNIVWEIAVDEDRITVTINAADFERLAACQAIHPGLITLPSGATAARQRELIGAALEWLHAEEAAGGDLVNRCLAVAADGSITVRALAADEMVSSGSTVRPVALQASAEED